MLDRKNFMGVNNSLNNWELRIDQAQIGQKKKNLPPSIDMTSTINC